MHSVHFIQGSINIRLLYPLRWNLRKYFYFYFYIEGYSFTEDSGSTAASVLLHENQHVLRNVLYVSYNHLILK